MEDDDFVTQYTAVAIGTGIHESAPAATVLFVRLRSDSISYK